ncbi:DUF4163 domain-containing protein [Candidatus Parcubacteria bacterium]|nr:DUF4163 domain-containing protein [Candidatus Parcubacteria bacterium]
MDVIKKRIYVSAFVLLGALIFAVFFILSRPAEIIPAKPIATSTPQVVYASNDSSYTVIGLTQTVPWHESCNGLGSGKKIDPIISIIYPQIQGLKNTEVQYYVNTALEQNFLNNPLTSTNTICGTSENPQSYENVGLDSSFDVKLQTDRYVSITYRASHNLLSGLRPTVESSGYTVDLDDGSVLSYKDFFKFDSESRQQMKNFVIAGLPRDVKSNPDVDRDILDYDFYLTKDGVTFFNIFLSPVFRDIEVHILYEKLGNLLLTNPA